MTTFFNGFFNINGVVSTDKSVLQNMNDIATAAGSWLTYDIATGKWSVVINRQGTSVASFNDNNIIGAINVSGTGVNELYNAATIEFPHRDLRDQKDYIDIKIQDSDKFPNEIENRLNISIDLINEPTQAEYLARLELKQSRLDKVIEFRTDFSKIGLKAGDLIDVTSSMYGYTNKLFRVVRLEEDDSDVLALSITALEYSESIYDNTGIIREVRDKITGIIPKTVNETAIASDNLATANSNVEGSNNLLTPAAISAALALASGPLFDFLKTTSSTAKAGAAATNPGTTIPSYASAVFQMSESYVLGEFNDFSGATDGTGFLGNSSAKPYVDFALDVDFNTMLVIVEHSYSNYTIYPRELYISDIGTDVTLLDAADPVNTVFLSDYGIDVVTSLNFAGTTSGPDTYLLNGFENLPTPRGITAYVPTLSTLKLNGNSIDFKDTGWTTANSVFVVENAPAGDYRVEFEPSVTYAPGVDADPSMYHGYYQSTGGLGGMVVTILAFKN